MQTSDTVAETERLAALEKAVGILGEKVAELSALLRGALPPSAVQTVEQVDLKVTDVATKGSKTAVVAVIEFSDFQCPFCGRHFQTTYPQLQRQFVDAGAVRYFFRNLPLEALHPLATKAAEAGECARDQGKFWEMHDQLFANQKSLAVADLISHAQTVGLDPATFRACLEEGKKASVVKRDVDEAQELGLTGTPAFLLGKVQPDGTVRVTKRIVGAHPLPAFQTAIQALLSESSNQP
jgi:protein-disulfide isomerase